MALTQDEQLAKLTEARDNILELIVKVTINPKPTYNIDGQEVKWAEYLDTLRKNLAAIEDLINDKEGPYELETIAYV